MGSGEHELGVGRPFDVDRLPVGVAHIDGAGTILAVNRTVGELLGLDPEVVVGQNLLDWVQGDVERLARMLDFGTGYTRSLMGPVPVQYHDAEGRLTTAHVWTQNLLHEPDVGAMVVVVPPPETRTGITQALTSIAEGDHVEDTLEILSWSLAGNPFLARGAWLVRDAGRARLVGSAALSEAERAALGTSGPWWEALRAREIVIGSEQGPDPRARALTTAGVVEWWVEPTRGRVEGIDAGLLVLRRHLGPPSPNQVEHLVQLVTVARLAVERSTMLGRLAHAATHDPLTGLRNRGGFFAEGDSLARGEALLYVDLDRFKPVNDTHGHAVGDLVLVAVAERIRSAVRPGDRVARLGGDEFVVRCLHVDGEGDATAIAQRIIEAVEAPLRIQGHDVSVGASVGIALTVGDEPVDTVLDRSDAALLEAKAAGRGRWHLARVPPRPDPGPG